MLEYPPADRKSNHHFHSAACFGMTGEVCAACVVKRELICSEASKTDARRLRVLSKRKRPTEWQSVEEENLSL